MSGTATERFAADAAGEYSPERLAVIIDGQRYGIAEARALGFARESAREFTRRWVQATGFLVRGLIERGDAQKFDPGELREAVRAWLADRGVRLRADTLEAVCFNYEPNVALDEARIAARVERELTAAFADS